VGACTSSSSTNNGSGGAGGAAGGGGKMSGSGGTAGGGTGGGAGGGAGGTAGSGVDAGLDARGDASTDAVTVSDAALTASGAYIRTSWTATYTCTVTCLPGNGDSPNDMPALAFDGNFQTRWSTDRNQQDFWNANPRQFPLFFTVDMKQVVNVSKVTMHPSCRDIFDAPGKLDVLVSLDGTTFTPAATNHSPAIPPNGEACPPNANSVATDTITFPTTPARFIQIKATQSLVNAHPTSGDKYWAIGEFNAFP